MNRPAQPGAQITFLYYRDLAPARVFYEEILGLDLVVDQGWAKIYRVSGAAFVGIVDERKGSRRARTDSAVLVTLVVDDVRAWRDHLERRGVPIVRDVAIDERIAVETCFVEDPGGYLIELQRFLSPADSALFGPTSD